MRKTEKMKIYNVSQKKTRHSTFGHDIGKYRPIFKVL